MKIIGHDDRFLTRLKSYVRNKAQPEGSIANGYLAAETVAFASRFLDDDVETWLNRHGRNDDRTEFDTLGQMCINLGRPLGAGRSYKMDNAELDQAHRYVLFNQEEVQPYAL